MKVLKGRVKPKVLLTVGKTYIIKTIEVYDETHDLCIFVVTNSTNDFSSRFELIEDAVIYFDKMLKL